MYVCCLWTKGFRRQIAREIVANRNICGARTMLPRETGFDSQRAGPIYEAIWIFRGSRVLIILIVVFSAIGLELFSSKKRLAHNLPSGIQLNDDIEQQLRNQMIKSTAVLAGGSAILLIMQHLFRHVLIIGLANLIFLSALSLDMIEQMRFSWKHSRSVELIELDNSHLASYLKGLFESSGVDVVFQTYHCRRLYFLFGSLAKMRMLIASEDVELARKLVDLTSIQII